MNLSVGFFCVKINDNVLISHLDAVFFIGYLKKFEGGGFAIFDLTSLWLVFILGYL